MIEQIGKIALDLTHYPGEDFYCDGRVEDELLEIAKNYAEAEYQEIIEKRASWPILYHLSPIRENIVEWIPMDPDVKVLEVGSGCGAITGALSRKAGEVVCVDLSKKRSLINAYRHSACENVSIHVGNFRDIEPDLPNDFDYIFLIGVFEYGQSYMGTDKPFEEFLTIIMKHLAEGGRVVIAIENKYGLKYFAGCQEDHLGDYFSGIENYAGGGGVRTFSRNGLEKIFSACGVENYNFYYPYPDYKFMNTLFSDTYFPAKGELCNNLRNFDRDRLLLFDEKYAFDGIVEDDLFSVFSNSYEVIIGEGFDIKYSRYSNDRAKKYRIRTEIVQDENGVKTVNKYPLCEEAHEHIREMAASYQNLKNRYEGGNLAINKCKLHESNGKIWISFEFIEGRLLSEILDECLEKDDIDGFHAIFRQYVERAGYNSTFSVTDIDLIFSNIMVQDDTWTVIDYEWTFPVQMDSKELAFRALHCYLLEDKKRSKLNPDLILEQLGITKNEEAAYREQEEKFQKFVTGQRKSMIEIRGMIGNQIIDPIKDMKANEGLNRVQIYEDYGNGYSEEMSYFIRDSYRENEQFEIEIKIGENVQALRIDPSFYSCMVKIEEMTLNGSPVPFQNKAIFSTNGKPLKYGTGIVFPTMDPNIYIKTANLDKQTENILYVKMEVSRLSQSLAEDIAASIKR